MNDKLGGFLNKQYIELETGFQDLFDNKIVLPHVLQENLDIVDNYCLLPLTVK